MKEGQRLGVANGGRKEGRKEVRRLGVTNGGIMSRPPSKKQYMFSLATWIKWGPKAEGPPIRLGVTSEDMLQTTLAIALGTADDGLGWWST